MTYYVLIYYARKGIEKYINRHFPGLDMETTPNLASFLKIFPKDQREAAISDTRNETLAIFFIFLENCADVSPGMRGSTGK